MGEIVPGRHGVPRVQHVHGRNLPFDALAAACDWDTTNPRQARILGTALKEIRSYFFEQVGVPDGVTAEEWEMALAKAIHAHARAYYEYMPEGSLLTPIGLAKWWHQVERPRKRRKKDVTASEFASRTDVPRPLQNLKRIVKEQP